MSRTCRPPARPDFHGGDLADAVARGQHADAGTSDWLDLSSGINPNAYPLPEIPAEVWTRLPGREDMERLQSAAAQYYGAPDEAGIVAGPGSQALIQVLPACLPELEISIVGPAYSGHAAAWEAAGRMTRERDTLAGCDPAGVAVVVNPNNPDGRTTAREDLIAFADEATRSGGWLVVDEAFCDLVPSLSVAPHCCARNLIALRSFGKFFGLAGLRLGVAIVPPDLAERLAKRLGPWALSGPALKVGAQALLDTPWQEQQRNDLQSSAGRLDACLAAHRLKVAGGTALFRLVETPRATALFDHLLEHRIYVRQFPEHPRWLRFGLPGAQADWQRLEAALRDFAA